MKIKELKKEIGGIFVKPVKRLYLGKIAYGTPYFNPIGFDSRILFIRKLKKRTTEQRDEYIKRYQYYNKLNRINESIYSNLPMVRRNKYWVIKDWYISIGRPFAIKSVYLGWKWKYDSIRYEWFPSFQIYFFKWQFVISYHAPDGDDDQYYEQILHWLYSANKDIDKAKQTWGWTDMQGNSTWKDYECHVK